MNYIAIIALLFILTSQPIHSCSIFKKKVIDDPLQRQATKEFMESAKAGSSTLVHTLATSLSINVNEKIGGETALYHAARQGHTKVAKTIMKLKGDPNIADTYGVTPLMQASRGGHAGIVKSLIIAQARVNAKSSMRCPNGTMIRNITALYIASQNGHTQAVETLAQAKANINACCSERVSPLAIASHMKQDDVVKLLLGYGADQTVRGINGKRAIDYADDITKKIFQSHPNTIPSASRSKRYFRRIKKIIQASRKDEEEEKRDDS